MLLERICVDVQLVAISNSLLLVSVLKKKTLFFQTRDQKLHVIDNKASPKMAIMLTLMLQCPTNPQVDDM